MLTLNSALMSSMDTRHLIRALECEPQIMRTPVELELIKRCHSLEEERDGRIEADAIQTRIDEAVAQYPEEGFLEKLSDRVFELGEKLRGDNKSEAREIAAALSELESELVNAADYGRDELNKIFTDN